MTCLLTGYVGAYSLLGVYCDPPATGGIAWIHVGLCLGAKGHPRDGACS